MAGQAIRRDDCDTLQWLAELALNPQALYLYRQAFAPLS
jgi:hypothetical protein